MRVLKIGFGILFLLVIVSVVLQEVMDKPKAEGKRAASLAGPPGNWTIQRGRSLFDDSPTVSLQLEAMKPISGWPGKLETPVLVLRCQEHKTEAYIRTGIAPSVEYGHFREATVRIRLDDDTATKRLASVSTDNHALFLREPIALIRSLLKHERLLFGFTPFNSAAVETEFDLEGLTQAIKPLQESCGWD